MPRKRLTAAFVEKVSQSTGRVDYFDTVLPAFGLRVGQRTKTYFVMVRALRNGEWKLQRATLGTTGEIDLATARQNARDAMDRAEQGKAPIEVKRERREAQKAESRDTFTAVRADFLRLYRTRTRPPRKPSERTLAELRRVLESDLFADWAERPLAQITRRDIMDVTDSLVERGHETAANRYLTYLRMMFGWSKRRGIIADDPTAEIDKPGMERSRDRVLSATELAAIWRGTEPTQANKGDLFGPIVRTLMLTGQRRTEVSGMSWPELDLDAGLWTLPAARAKNRREHLVPLSPPVISILRARAAEQEQMGMDSALVFTSSGTAPFSGWSRGKARLDARVALPPWTLHDLRRSFVTRCAEDIKAAPHVVEAIVNHVGVTRSGVAGVYNRALYLEERRSALGAWARYVMRILEGRRTDDVV